MDTCSPKIAVPIPSICMVHYGQTVSPEWLLLTMNRLDIYQCPIQCHHCRPSLSHEKRVMPLPQIFVQQIGAKPLQIATAYRSLLMPYPTVPSLTPTDTCSPKIWVTTPPYPLKNCMLPGTTVSYAIDSWASCLIRSCWVPTFGRLQHVYIQQINISNSFHTHHSMQVVHRISWLAATGMPISWKKKSELMLMRRATASV